jgi:uncharacterized membrane protein
MSQENEYSGMNWRVNIDWRRLPWESAFWLSALLFLALTEPASGSHFTLCPLKALGVNFCPGCNIGHAIALLLHGDVQQSLNVHWLGIPAVLLLVTRSGMLLYHYTQHLRRANDFQ